MIDVKVMQRMLLTVDSTTFATMMSSFEEIEIFATNVHATLNHGLVLEPMLPRRGRSQDKVVLSSIELVWPGIHAHTWRSARLKR